MQQVTRDRTAGDTEDLVGVSTAATELETTRATLRERIRAGEVDVWHDPLDRRRKLVRRSDLARLAAPRREGAPPTSA